MLRECVKHEPLAKIILESEEFYRFYGYVELSTFDIASDAFSTFRVSDIYFSFKFCICVCLLVGIAYSTQSTLCSFFRNKL